MPPADCLLCSPSELGWPRMLWVPYSEVDRANTLLVVPGRALRGVALGGGRTKGSVGRLEGESGGTDRGGRLAAGRDVVPGDSVVVELWKY